MDPRLLQTISNPAIQAKVDELLGLVRAALEDLSHLDEGLYERFVRQRTDPLDPMALFASLRWLWHDTFAGLMTLLDQCGDLQAAQGPVTPPAAVEGTDDLEFGDLEGLGEAAPAEGELDLGIGDIGNLLDNLSEEKSDADTRWARVVERLSSLEYGLRSQLTDAEQRRDVALESGQANTVLGLLDDAQGSASEGVHAMVTAVYEVFLPEVNTSTLVPGYLTTLSRALLVRRGLAALDRMLGPQNDLLQADPSRPSIEVLDNVRIILKAFVESAVCRAMRPADRWQMVEFERELAEQAGTVARLTCEGLVKYVESLASVNQREVLVRHDQRVLEELRELLSSARGLLELSPGTVVEMLTRAGRLAHELRGRLSSTDRLLEALGPAPTSPTTAAMTARLEELEALLAASGG